MPLPLKEPASRNRRPRTPARFRPSRAGIARAGAINKVKLYYAAMGQSIEKFNISDGNSISAAQRNGSLLFSKRRIALNLPRASIPFAVPPVGIEN